MDDDDVKYELRSKKRSRKSRPNPKNLFKRQKLIKNMRLTKDGYLDDGFVVDADYDPDEDRSVYFDLDSEPIQKEIISRMVSDTDLSSERVETIVKDAFMGAGEYLIQDYVGCKPSENWKLGLSARDIKTIEPELNKIRDIIKEETPTIPKIINSNITIEDKKRAIKLYDQLQNTEPYTPEYNTVVETINNIIRKGKNRTKSEIRKLEQTETRLKTLSTSPDNLKTQILKLNADEKVKSILYGQYLEMLEHEPGTQSYNNIREEIEWSVKLPHNTARDFANLSTMNNRQLNRFYSKFLKDMDKELYAMKNIKMKMLRILNDRRRGASGSNIAISGLPGCGKTAIGKAFAKVLGLPFEKISVGGLEDASVLKGDKKVWQGAAPSIVLQILARMKSSNGVIMFDEVDKLGQTNKGRVVQYALLHISDYVHNKEFADDYLNKYSHDFSQIFFIYNMNTTEGLDPALLSRLDVIEVETYTEEDKINIITGYTLPRALENVGMKRSDVTITKSATKKLLTSCVADDGLRSIEKIIKDIVGKINMYNSIVLKDGTTGNIDLPYKIPKLPMVLNTKMLAKLS